MFLSVVKDYAWFIVLLLLISCGNIPSEQSVTEVLSENQIEAMEPTSLPPTPTALFSPLFLETAVTYQQLRPQQGQFSGGEWVEEIDAWNGRKHQAMQTLANELANGTFAKDVVIQQLGEPDEQLSPSGDRFNLILEMDQTYSKETAQILVYHWRGDHDYLFMLTDGQMITAVDWWYAGE